MKVSLYERWKEKKRVKFNFSKRTIAFETWVVLHFLESIPRNLLLLKPVRMPCSSGSCDSLLVRSSVPLVSFVGGGVLGVQLFVLGLSRKTTHFPMG